MSKVFDTQPKQVSAFIQKAEENGFEITSVVNAFNQSILVLAEKGDVKMVFNWCKALKDACEFVCLLTGEHYDEFVPSDNSLSVYDSEHFHVAHSIKRHAFDSGAFILTMRSRKESLDGDEFNMRDIAKGIENAICA